MIIIVRKYKSTSESLDKQYQLIENLICSTTQQNVTRAALTLCNYYLIEQSNLEPSVFFHIKVQQSVRNIL